MPEIKITVKNKVATAEHGAKLVCGNSDYTIKFDFDEEWSGHNFKTALFVFKGQLVPVAFDGNVCKAPIIRKATLLGVGVKASDGGLRTTTPAYIPCDLSSEDIANKEIEEPTPSVYDEIIALLNKYISGGGGGSSGGGLTEEQVREIVAEETDALSQDISVINLALEQSGLVKKYKQPITQEYTERVTADGASVLDGSKAVLKKVVGSTVACKNLVDIPFIDVTMKGQEIAVNFSQDLFVSVGELATTAASVWRFSFSRKGGEVIYVYDAELERGGKKISATEDNPIVKIAYRPDHITTGKYSKIMIAYGSTATEYQPYFTGLKSASFAGIESKNADGTETSTLDFPKTETPLGTTIDFENKKITDYGVTIELKGTEGINYSSALGNGSVFFSALVGEEKNAIGVCTDATIVQKNPSEVGEMQIGDGRSGANPVFWKGILAQLGFWASADDNSTAVTQFKAYLAQRYADGNPVTIRYLSSVLQSETDFTADNEYTAYKGGTETVLDNDGNEYGADNTLTQDYILVTAVE